MFDWLTDPDFTDFVALLSLAGLAFAVLTGAVASWLRSRELSAIEPPSPEEIEEIRAMRTAGSFRLPAASSAVGRHFEQSLPKFGDRIGGGRGCYEPPMVESWREHRS